MAEQPSLSLVYEATVDIAEREFLGVYPDGEHHIVPILGGEFEGPNLRGKVLPGGADRQVWQGNGIKRLDAVYEMLTSTGECLAIHNQVVIDDPGNTARYARSVIRIKAPSGPLEWMNHRVFVGSLESLKPLRKAVLVRVFLLE